MDMQYKLLEQFVNCLKKNPNIIHEPKLAFFRDYVESLGATIPPKQEEKAEKSPEPTEEPMEIPEEEEIDIPYPEIDNSGVIEADTPEDLPMGEEGKQVTDEDQEKADEARTRAAEAFSNGDFATAVKEFTTAIVLNPGSAMLHGKRANALLKLNKPVTAIADCDKAIKINPDSALGYKFRGRANRLLGKWVEAHKDLAIACKLDYDDVANEWLKETDVNAKKLMEHQRAVERAKEEKELRERRERVRRAQEENKKAREAEEARRAAEGEMPGGMPFDDPELAELLEDPEVAAALQEAMTNPANLMKHMSNPKVAKALGKMKGMFGGGMPGFGGPGGMPGFGGPGGMPGFPGAGGCADASCHDTSCGGGAPKPSAAPKKAPEPDLD